MSPLVKRILAFGAAVAIGVVVGKLGMTGSSAPTHGSAATGRQTPDAHELARLRAQVSDVTRRVRSLGRGSPARDAVFIRTAPAGAQSDDEVTVPLSSHERAQALTRALDAESTNSPGRVDFESRIRDAFSADEFRAARLAGVRCGSSMCRAVLEFDDAALLRKIARLTPTQPAFASAGFIHYSSETSVEVFLARDGEELPAL